MRTCVRDVVDDDGTPHKFRDVVPSLLFFPPLLFWVLAAVRVCEKCSSRTVSSPLRCVYSTLG